MDRITLKFRSERKQALAEDMLRLCCKLGFLPGYTLSWNSDKPRWITLKKKRGSFSKPRK
jgi:hypothetical protein